MSGSVVGSSKSSPPVVQPLSFYLGLIPSFNASKPKFMAMVEALVAPAQGIASFLNSMVTAFDLDSAIGVQLDQVGVRVGASRNVQVPLTGIYFSWGTPGLGWGQGSWKGAFDPNTGLQVLDDDSFRILIRAKIAANSWDGTNGSLPDILSIMFPATIGTYVVVLDNNDYTMTVGVSGLLPSQIQLALLDGGYVPITPATVGLNFYITSVDTAPLFAWGVNTSAMAGWGTGAWGLSPSDIGDIIQPQIPILYTGATINAQANVSAVATRITIDAQTASFIAAAANISVSAVGPWRVSALVSGTANVAVISVVALQTDSAISESTNVSVSPVSILVASATINAMGTINSAV